MTPRLTSLILLASAAAAQSVQVYSEFRRVDPFGKIVAADRGGSPREILSPAVARNAFASFQIVVSSPPAKAFELHIAQNPENSVRPTLYRQVHHEGIPDRLDPIASPAEGVSSYAKPVFCYWLDLWIPTDLPPERIRVEAQLHVDDRWIIYPMEIRVAEARASDIEARPVAMPPVESRSDAAVFGPWRAAACGKPETPAKWGYITIRSLIRRNALQDVALAGGRSAESWCGAPPARDNPEWYLRLRDQILGSRL